MAVTKSELIEQLTQRVDGITYKVAEVVVNTIFYSMKEALMRDERIEIRGFRRVDRRAASDTDESVELAVFRERRGLQE